VQIIKSITAREIFKACPGVRQQLWGGEFWTDGYFIATVGAHGNGQMIQNYVRQQGQVEATGQLRLF
jgi:putative transposase